MDTVLSSSISSSSNWNVIAWKTNRKFELRSLKTAAIRSSMKSWSLSDGNSQNADPKPAYRNPRQPIPDDYARSLVKGKAGLLSVSRSTSALAPKWIRRTPEQMVRYLEDDRNGQLYGKHVVAATKAVRAMSEKKAEERDIRIVMSSFVGKLSFREMCYVLKEQKGWREARDFFSWMKLQLSYRPDVIVYTILLRIYGKVGKINMAEEMFLEMMDTGCEPDEVACGTMLCCYARWGRFNDMFSFYSALEEINIVPPVSAYNFMLSSLQKRSFHEKVIEIWKEMVGKHVTPNGFTYTLVINSLVKLNQSAEAFNAFYAMRRHGHVPEEDLYCLLISASTKNGDWDETARLHDDMVSLKIIPSNFTYASLLSMCYKSGEYVKAMSLYVLMRRQRVPVDEVIYGLMIRIYSKLGRYEDAQREFAEVEETGLLRSDKTYLAMAQVHLNAGECEKCLRVMEMMKSRNLSPSRFSYIVSLQCYVMKEDLRLAEDSFQDLSESGFPDAGSCSDMLNLYRKLNLIVRAKDLIAQIRKNKVEFSEELFKLVVDVQYQEGSLREIEELVDGIVESQSLKGSKFYITVKTVLNNIEHLGSFSSSDEIDLQALQIMTSLFLGDGRFNEIENILTWVLTMNAGFHLADLLVSRIVEGGDLGKVKNLFALMRRRRIMLGKNTAASLIKVCGEEGNLENARELFAKLPEPKATAYNSMIEAYTRQNESKKRTHLANNQSKAVP